MDYETMKDSLYNTPPCWSIYMCSLMFDHLLEQGGLETREQLNQQKADILYNTVDKSNGFYAAPVHESVRSRMNVPFIIPSKPELEKEFVSEAVKLGMVGPVSPFGVACHVQLSLQVLPLSLSVLCWTWDQRLNPM